jgi:hypothetical protein
MSDPIERPDEFPRLGDIVHYREPDHPTVVRAAIVIATQDTIDPAGSPVPTDPPLSDPENVHLRVLTPTDKGDYTVHDVRHQDRHIAPAPGCWGFPERTERRPAV